MRRAIILLTLALVPTFIASSVSACPMRHERPMLAQNYLEKAKRAERRGQDARALRLYQRAMYTERHNGKKFRAAMSLGKLADRLGQTRVARRGYARAVTLKPRSGEAHAGLGIALLDINAKGALEKLVKASKLGVKRFGDVLAAISQAQSELGQIKRARKTLARAKRAGASQERIEAAEHALPKAGVTVASRN